MSTAACLHSCHRRELAGQQSLQQGIKVVCPCGMQQKRLVLLKAVVEMPLTSCFLFGFVLVSSTHGTLSPPTFAAIACLVLSVRLRQHHQCNLFSSVPSSSSSSSSPSSSPSSSAAQRQPQHHRQHAHQHLHQCLHNLLCRHRHHFSPSIQILLIIAIMRHSASWSWSSSPDDLHHPRRLNPKA